MSDTTERIKKAFNRNRLNKSKLMSESKHEEYEDRIDRAKRNPNSKHSREALALLEDMVDTDRYYSSGKREPIPYERQRELQLSTPKQPQGPSVSTEEAYRKYRQNRRPRNKN